jgi:hypothetical protein
MKMSLVHLFVTAYTYYIDIIILHKIYIYEIYIYEIDIYIDKYDF